MRHTGQQIIADIDAYMSQHGGKNPDWYVGIATDARRRLFDEHKVLEKGGAWIYRLAVTTDIARQVEKAYLAAGCDGGTGGGDEGTDYVYAYKKTPATEP